jgi:hypothetical protein
LDATGRRVGEKVTNEHCTRAVSDLFRFLLVFGIDRFTLHREARSRISATIGWPLDNKLEGDEDDETQEIEWDVQTFDNMDDVLAIVEYVRDNNLIKNDRFLIDQGDLLRIICDHYFWDRERFEQALRSLLKFRVDMLDDGEKSDHFFLHF